jgi:uncharacterized Ntn-hydrolase superfamily protein
MNRQFIVFRKNLIFSQKKNEMRKILTLIMLLGGSLGISAQDTFSIIAVDPDTGEIGSAGASCVTGVGPNGIIDIITKIIPGRGGVNSQAYVCIPNVNLNNAIDQMEQGSSPTEIIDWLINNDACSAPSQDPAYRQYGIADFDPNGDPRTAGYTGNLTDAYTEDRQGPTYSIQGNILLDQSIIDNMEDGFNNTTGTLADKLMAAMQGANVPGADSRCLNSGTSSTTAYLLVYRPDDDPNDPYIRLNVGQQPAGVEPIDLLQDLYDAFLSTPDNTLANSVELYPNPASNEINFRVTNGSGVDDLEIVNVNGKVMLSLNGMRGSTQMSIGISDLAAGVYFLRLKGSSGSASLKFVKK